MADAPPRPPRGTGRAASARALLGRLDAALVSGTAKFWSELLRAYALAGQCAAGARCFPPDPPGPSADGRVGRRQPSAASAEWLPDDVQ